LLNLNPSIGLAQILADPKAPIQFYPMPDSPKVSLLFAGGISDQPAELLGSERMKELLGQWRKQFDYVILDSPPALAVTDPIILASLADTVLMVVRHSETSRQAMTLAYRMLSNAARNQHVGVIINGVREGSSAFYE
jgi:Mrp family chromosome partitioning ATPase